MSKFHAFYNKSIFFLQVNLIFTCKSNHFLLYNCKNNENYMHKGNLMQQLISLFILSGVITINSFALSCDALSEFKQYGGKWYAISAKKLTWDNAKIIAENNGGYLAIPRNANENQFLRNAFNGGWIGIYDPSYSSNYCGEADLACISSVSRFKTVLGETLTYHNFAEGEPSNTIHNEDIINGEQMVAPLGEHWVAMGQNGQWGDFGNHARENNNPIRMRAIFEFANKPECAPESGVAETDYTAKKCQTQVYDISSGILGEGQLFDCKKDKFGTDYCPASLARADTYWDYEDGYSVENSGSVVDYIIKENKELEVVSGDPNFKFSKQFCTDHWAKVLLVPDGHDLHFILVAQNPDGATDGRCNYSNYSSAWLKSKGVAGWNVPKAFMTMQILKFNNPITKVDGFTYTFSSSGSGCSNVSGSGVGNSSTSSTNDPYYNGYAFDNKSLTNCGASGAQWPLVNINFQSIYVISKKCPPGYIETTGAETSKGECKKTVEYTYYNYLCSDDINQQGLGYEPQNPGGDCKKTDSDGTKDNSTDLSEDCNSPNPPTNNCKRQGYTCNSEVRDPVWIDEMWQCSPFPCFGEEDYEDLDTPVGATDAIDKGFNDDGSCYGQIRIFNGKDMRCRSMDWSLLGKSCCSRWKIGGIAGLLGASCKEDEIALAKYRQEQKDKSHEVGEYCSKKLRLGFTKICIQKKRTYCVFNSKLARIMHEGGRPQLGIKWGSPESPNCKGFTPEQFQKLDFSKIDMSEFYSDIQQDISQKIDGKIGTTIQQKVESFGGNLGGNN